MAGIAGIAGEKRMPEVEKALSRLAHRGQMGKTVRCTDGATFGVVWPRAQEVFSPQSAERAALLDGELYNWPTFGNGTDPLEAIENAYRVSGPEFLKLLDGPFALAIARPDGFFLARDVVGVAPLYVGTSDDRMCFASEMKALQGWASDISEFPPGHYLEPGGEFAQYDTIVEPEPLDQPPQEVASELRERLRASVQKRAAHGDVGAWLSGGMDSAALTALAAQEVPNLQTFSVGMEGSSDLQFAREVASFCGAKHRERLVDVDEALSALPEVIYHLESFDALLVRSSVMNFLVGKLASEHVPAVLSGEGGDELFAGYEYLKQLPMGELTGELVDITLRLHNTALQRVDRCSSAHGLVARTGFLDRAVVQLAMRIPPEMKIMRAESAAEGWNGSAVEKWILRRAMDGLLPQSVLDRPKAKFWEGAGVGEQLATRAEEAITDREFSAERRLEDGRVLASKEELLYYRVFREHLGSHTSGVVGRTKVVAT